METTGKRSHYYGWRPIASTKNRHEEVLVIRENGRQVSCEPTGVVFASYAEAWDVVAPKNAQIAAAR